MKVRWIRNVVSALERYQVPDFPSFLPVLDSLWQLLFDLWAGAAGVDKAVYPFFTQLQAIKRQLATMKDSGAWTVEDVTAIQEEMTTIEQTHVHDGKFFESRKKAAEDPGNPAPGQAILSSLLNQNRESCLKMCLSPE
jgi:hypothetical protein